MAPVRGDAAPSRPRPRPALDRAIGIYLREPLLWPVLIVLVGHVVALLAVLLLLGWRDGSAKASLWLLLFAAGSLALVTWEWRWRRRPGAYAGVACATWALAAAVAWAADRAGAF